MLNHEISYRAKLFKSEEECLELRRAKKELEVAKANLEEEVTKRQNSQVSLECQVGMCKTDLTRYEGFDLSHEYSNLAHQ